MNKEKELYKKVKKVSLQEVFPDHTFPPGFNYGVIDENNNILNFCSKKYNLIPNKLLFKPIEKHLNDIGLDYNRNINIINGSKFYVDYIIKDKCKSPSINDVFPKISLWNSYDGTTKFRREFGYYKLVCSNGFVSPLSNIAQEISKHSVEANAEMNAEFVEDFVKSFLESTIKFLRKTKDDMSLFEQMNITPANAKDIESIAKFLNYSKIVTNVATERFEIEIAGGAGYHDENNDALIHQGSKPTLFAAYNALNYSIYNTQLKELPEKKIEKDIKLLKTISLSLN